MALTRPKYSNIVDTDYKQSVRLVTTTDITLTGGTPSSYDSINLVAGDRILVTGQSNQTQNGIYVVQTVGTGSNGTWIRSYDANTNEKVTAGFTTFVGEGTYASQQWRLTTPDPINLGVTNLTFSPFQLDPGGSTGQFQYNAGGDFGGAANLKYDSTTGNVLVSGNNNSVSTTTGAFVVVGGVGIAGNTNVGNIFAGGFYFANGTPFVSSTYGNVEVAAYLLTDTTINGIQANLGAYQIYANANIGSIKNDLSVLDANVGTLRVDVNSTNANLGAYQIYANANVGTIKTDLSTLDANIGAYQTWANLELQEVNSNLGAYQVYANANIGTIKNDLDSLDANVGSIRVDLNNLDANVGSYQIYANANIGTIKTDLSELDSNVGAYQTWANLELQDIDSNLGAYQVYANANVGTIKTDLSTLDANVGAYQIYANANIGAIKTDLGALDSNVGAYQTFANLELQDIDSNLGAYQIYANANIGTIKTDLSTLDANVGAYQVYANANIGTIKTDLSTLNANVGAYQIFANANLGILTTDISNLVSGANTNTAAYLPSYSGNIDANITRVSQPFITTLSGLTSFGPSFGTTLAQGNLTVIGNLTVQGNTITIGSNNLSVVDSIIDLHTPQDLSPLFTDDGRDIGIRFHYYKGEDRHTFFGWENFDETLVYFQTSTETDSNITGTPGNVKFGSLYLANATVSSSTGSGALVVAGGVGIGGALYITNTGDVSANLGTVKTDLGTLNANVGAYQTFANLELQDIDSNLGAYQSYANANVGTIKNNLSTLDANVGAYQIYANANIGTIKSDLSTLDANVGVIKTDLGTLDANVGAYQIYANANIGTIKSDLSTLDANVGSFETYANTKIGNNSNSNLVVLSATESTSNTTGAIVVTGGAGIAGNLYANVFYTSYGIRWAGNGAVFASGGGGGGGTPGGDSGEIQFNNGGSFDGANIVFDPVNGNLVITSVTHSTTTTTGALVISGGLGVAGNIVGTTAYLSEYPLWSANSARQTTKFTTSTTAPASPIVGDQWYDSSTDIIYEYINDGVNSIWVDIGSALSNTFVVLTGTTVNAQTLLATGGTAATSTSTGDLQVTGGVGVGGAIYAGSIQNTPIGSTTAATGTFTTLIATGNVVAAAGTDSVNSTTGAAVVLGGLGVTGNINVAATGNIYQNGIVVPNLLTMLTYSLAF